MDTILEVVTVTTQEFKLLYATSDWVWAYYSVHLCNRYIKIQDQ